MYKEIKIIPFLVGGLILSFFTGCGSPLTVGPWVPSTFTPTPVPPLQTPTVTFTGTNTPTNTFATASTKTPTNTNTSINTPTPTFTATFTDTRTPIFTPTNTTTFTSLPTSTFTSAPTTITYIYTPVAATSPTPTPSCQNYIGWGETGTTHVYPTRIYPGTIFQSYVVTQTSKLTLIGIYNASNTPGTILQMGLYADGGGLPSTLIYSDSPRQISWGSNHMNLPIGGIPLAVGTYWIAVSTTIGYFDSSTPCLSSAKITLLPPGTMPAVFPTAQANPNPAGATGQIDMEGLLSTCF